ncbi:probable methyltransferase TCM_000336 [Oryza sativa Japonica Group]|uniref:probable methyltransferase TCM_000336 n=1 Tax=Oryza sativa subsp. japonica TaxID=39947 RepID=UPI00339D2739
MKPLIEAAVVDMFEAGLPARFGVADLDCASGPNALALISTAINAVHHHLLGPAPAAASRCDELTVLLNDLPTNDFTSAMTGLPLLRQKHSVVGSGVDYWPGVFVSVVPGTFYGRLFPERTMHLVCSSFSLHWLSKVRPCRQDCFQGFGTHYFAHIEYVLVVKTISKDSMSSLNVQRSSNF